MSNPWEFYDALIDLVPPDARVTEAVSSRWSAIATDAGHCGLAMTLDSAPSHELQMPAIVGRSLRDVAALVKSWDYRVASLGTAAINAALNTAQRLAQTDNITQDGATSTFGVHAQHMIGRKVAVIGRFPDLDRHAATCDMTVLERNPGEHDLPDPACEYVLAGQDDVYITGTTVTNKTLPRLLALSEGARVTLVGPSVPLAFEVYRDRVAEVGGALVSDRDQCLQLAASGASIPPMRPAITFFNATH